MNMRIRLIYKNDAFWCFLNIPYANDRQYIEGKSEDLRLTTAQFINISNSCFVMSTDQFERRVLDELQVGRLRVDHRKVHPLAVP